MVQHLRAVTVDQRPLAAEHAEEVLDDHGWIPVFRRLARTVHEHVAEHGRAQDRSATDAAELLTEALRQPVHRARLGPLALVERPAAHPTVRVERGREHDLRHVRFGARLDEGGGPEGVRSDDLDERLRLRPVLDCSEVEYGIDSPHRAPDGAGRAGAEREELLDYGRHRLTPQWRVRGDRI